MDSFFGIGLFELVMIAIIALVVLGPERLPGAMREVGKYARQLRDVSNEFQSQFSEELKMLDEINPRKVISSALDPNASPPAKPPAAAAAAAQAAKPAAAAKPLAATKPAAAAAPAPVVNGETANSILPPPPAAVEPAPAAAPAVNDETADSTLPPTPAAVEPGTAAEVSPPPEPVTDPDAGAEEPR
jgi:sec-independent protein translocase protein TatB